MHPLLTPRLFTQAETAPLPPLRARVHRPVRDWLVRSFAQAYLRHGSTFGFVGGLALAWWLLAPHFVR